MRRDRKVNHFRETQSLDRPLRVDTGLLDEVVTIHMSSKSYVRIANDSLRFFTFERSFTSSSKRKVNIQKDFEFKSAVHTTSFSVRNLDITDSIFGPSLFAPTKN